MSNRQEKNLALISPIDDAHVTTALVLVRKTAGAGDQLATCVASFVAEYNNLDSEINSLTGELVGQERKLAVRYRDDLLPMINQMQMLLSQRGALYELVANDRSLLGVLAPLEDVPTWTEWYEAFASRFDGAKSLRTVQRQLKKLRGGNGATAGADTSSSGDETDGGTEEPSSHSGLCRDDEGKSAAELLAEHAKKMLDVLTGSSIIMSDTSRITCAVSLVKDLQRALEDGFLVVSAPGPTPTVRVIEGEIAPDGSRDAMATLRGVFNRLADTADIEKALEFALDEFAQPMMAEHPYMKVDSPHRPELQISVSFHRPGQARVSAGDWVEYHSGDDRLTKQIGAEAALGRVVEAVASLQPRITWFNGMKWLKPYALFDGAAVHVLFADQAAALYPDAFNSYAEPTLSKPHAEVPTNAAVATHKETDASASPVPSATPGPAAPAGCHGLEDAREDSVVYNAISPSPAESQVVDNSPAPSADLLTEESLPPGETMWTQLAPGKKYQVRPAPHGGYGIYEARSTSLLQWHSVEDDARDAIDQLQASVLVA